VFKLHFNESHAIWRAMARYITGMRVICLLLLFCCLNSIAFGAKIDRNGPGPKNDFTTSINKITLLRLVNEARKKGCQCGDTYYPSAPDLTWNEKLEQAAAEHSNDMFNKKYFSHTSPDGSKAGERIERTGYHWLAYGENIGMGFRNEQEMIEGWLKSPGHCKNIMNKDYKEMGAARAGNYWTQTFGARRQSH
jgi:uncharacterized protein YkwD